LSNVLIACNHLQPSTVHRIAAQYTDPVICSNWRGACSACNLLFSFMHSKCGAEKAFFRNLIRCCTIQNATSALALKSLAFLERLLRSAYGSRTKSGAEEQFSSVFRCLSSFLFFLFSSPFEVGAVQVLYSCLLQKGTSYAGPVIHSAS
jgi:hypothetical protein